MKPLLEARQIRKQFSGVAVLKASTLRYARARCMP